MDSFSAMTEVAKVVVGKVQDDTNTTGGNSSAISNLGFQLCRVPVNASSTECVNLSNDSQILAAFNIILACIAMIVLQFVQKRVKKCPNCLFGRPGLLIPVDLLKHSKYRLIYVAIFGSMSFLFYDVLNGSATPQVTVSNQYAQSVLSLFVTLLFVGIICINYYPLFACVDTPIPIIGHSVGLIFSILYLANQSMLEYRDYTGCANGCQAEGLPFAVQVMSDAPVMLLQLFLVLWYFGSIFHDIYVIIDTKSIYGREYNHLKDHIKRVRHRLTTEKEEISKVKIGLAKIRHFIYPYDPAFKFPLRFLSGMIVALCIIYRLAFAAIFYCIQGTIAINQTRRQFFAAIDELKVEFSGTQLLSPLTATEPVIRIILYVAVVLGAFLTVAVVVSTTFCLVQLFLTVRNVSEHLRKSTRGDTSFLPDQFPTLHRGLMASFRYPGYLIAYSIWAWVVYSLIFLLIVAVLVIGGVVVYFLINIIGPQIAVLVIGLAWTQALYWSQYFFTQFVFLEKAYPDSEHLVLNNRRLMHWFTYFFLFHNAFVGLFSTFIRIFMSLAFGLLTFSRLDKVLLIRGLESFDAANRTYVGMLYLDYVQNNSVMNVFCHILLKQIKLKRQLSGEEIENDDNCCSCGKRPHVVDPEEMFRNAADNYTNEQDEMYKDPPRPLVSQRAYNRWRVAYTLIRNESLIEFTASSLAQNRRKSLREKMHHLNDSIMGGSVNVASVEGADDQQDVTMQKYDDTEKM